MQELSTIVARYRATLSTYVDTQYVPISTDEVGRILLSHNGVSGTEMYSSVRIGDGSQLLDLLAYNSDTVSGSNPIGIAALGRKRSNGTVWMPEFDDAGSLYVIGNMELDWSIGTEADVATDEAGLNTEPGVADSIGVASYVDIATITYGSGDWPSNKELEILGVHLSADKLCQFRLVTVDSSVITAYKGNWMVTENVASYDMQFPRAISIVGQASRVMKLQAIRRRTGAQNATATGRINAYAA